MCIIRSFKVRFGQTREIMKMSSEAVFSVLDWDE